MQIHVESVLPCSPLDAWHEVCRTELLRKVSWPLVTFAPVDSAALPVTWRDGEIIHLNCRLFGILPLGIRTLRFERIDAAARQIQTREHDRWIRRWDHLISLRPHHNVTLYSDTVEIDAGRLTPLIWLFAQCFYRHRQRRWQPIARIMAIASKSQDLGRDSALDSDDRKCQEHLGK